MLGEMEDGFIGLGNDGQFWPFFILFIASTFTIMLLLMNMLVALMGAKQE